MLFSLPCADFYSNNTTWKFFQLSARSHDQSWTVDRILTLWCTALLVSSHHHPPMNFYHISLLLLVVLPAYSESPQHAKPPDSPHCARVTICLNSSSAQLGVLAPVLPQVEVYMFTQPNHIIQWNVPIVNRPTDLTIHRVWWAIQAWLRFKCCHC